MVVLYSLQTDAQRALEGTTAQQQLQCLTFGDFQGRNLDFGNSQLRPWKRACLSYAHQCLFSILKHGNLAKSAEPFLQYLELKRISDYGGNKDRVISWLENSFPVSQPVAQQRPHSAPGSIPISSAPSTSTSIASGSNIMSRPKLELGSNNKMFNSALKHIKRLPKDE
jgi:hypothetical protein